MDNNDDILSPAERERAKTDALAREIAKRKSAERRRLKVLEKKAETDRREGLPVSGARASAMEDAREKVGAAETIEAVEAMPEEPFDINRLRGKVANSVVNKALMLQGTSRPEVTRLLNSLNINLSLRLTKADTANLLACLLTCNETQLSALMDNKRVPLAIKTVIKRILEDAKYGNTDTVERLWDRVFGKGPMQLDIPPGSSARGIIPDTPVSREAYIVIRDTLLK